MIRWLRAFFATPPQEVPWQPSKVVVKFSGYDEQKAVNGFYRSQKQSETGRKYRKPKAAAKSTNVVAFRREAK